jgi:hypothetical protein
VTQLVLHIDNENLILGYSSVMPSLSINCQILFDKSCVLPTSKKICKIKKRVHLQQFDVIHLANPDLTYTRNPDRNKILCVPFHLLKTYIRNPSLFFIFFWKNSIFDHPTIVSVWFWPSNSKTGCV